MKKIFCILMLTFTSFSMGMDALLSKKDKFSIWPRIVFYQAGDFKEFEVTMAQSRDEVRQQFMKEFMDAMLPLVMMGGDATQ